MAARTVRGISQARAAQELRVARSAYRLWEMGVARPAPERWQLLADWLGVSMATLLLAEGVTSDGERGSISRSSADATREPFRVDAAASGEAELVREMHELVDSSVSRRVVTSQEAIVFRELLERMGDSRGRLRTRRRDDRSGQTSTTALP